MDAALTAIMSDVSNLDIQINNLVTNPQINQSELQAIRTRSDALKKKIDDFRNRISRDIQSMHNSIHSDIESINNLITQNLNNAN